MKEYPSQLHSVLLIQLGDIGDVVLTSPTIRAVKEAYPTARVSILVRKPFGSLLAADPHLAEIVEFAKPKGSLVTVARYYLQFARQLRAGHHDLTIDLRTGDRGAIFSFLTGARVRVGRQGSDKPFWYDLLFTRLIADPSVGPAEVHPGADQSLRIVRQLGIDTADSIPKLFLADHDRLRATALLAENGLAADDRFVTINMYSRWSYKEWDSGKWGEVMDWIWETYRLPAVLIGSADEAAGCAAMTTGHENRRVALAGQTTLGELAAVIEKSTLHLGVDSAAPHIAAAVGTPSLTIHGPSDWKDWRIVNEMHRIVSPQMDCVPCYRMGCDDSQESKCLEQLSVPEVTAVVSEIIRTILPSG